MRYIFDLAYIGLGLIFCPLVVYRAWRFGRYRQGWGQRLGRISRHHPQRPCIWLHAVSVGETNAARGVVTRLQNLYPDYEIVVSATTDTGYARAQQLYGDSCEVFYFPLDLSWVMSRAFRRLRPCLCLLMELEVWPNYMALASQHQIPIVVVNGRISDRSFRSYQRVRPLLRPAFARVRLALAQTTEYAQRFTELGCDPGRVTVTGSLKYDTAHNNDRISETEEIAQQLGLTDAARIWVAGGTGDGEERLILEAYQALLTLPAGADLRLVLVPRKPERFDQVAQLIEEAGFTLQRYGPIKEGHEEALHDQQAVILVDTMGDLRKFYGLANVVFVGRSLVPIGGSDMMEAAALGKPVLFGPHTQNFRQTVSALLQGQGALEVHDVPSLTDAVRRCLIDAEFAAKLGANGRSVIRANQGATERTLAHIQAVLPAKTSTSS